MAALLALAGAVLLGPARAGATGPINWSFAANGDCAARNVDGTFAQLHGVGTFTGLPEDGNYAVVLTDGSTRTARFSGPGIGGRLALDADSSAMLGVSFVPGTYQLFLDDLISGASLLPNGTMITVGDGGCQTATTSATPTSSSPARVKAAGSFACRQGLMSGDVTGFGLTPLTDMISKVMIDGTVVASDMHTTSDRIGDYMSTTLTFRPDTATTYDIELDSTGGDVLGAASYPVSCLAAVVPSTAASSTPASSPATTASSTASASDAAIIEADPPIRTATVSAAAAAAAATSGPLAKTGISLLPLAALAVVLLLGGWVLVRAGGRARHT